MKKSRYYVRNSRLHRGERGCSHTFGWSFFDGKEIKYKKSPGRLKALVEMTHDGSLLPGHLGIGHTRWATHGEPSEENAHPQFNAKGTIAVVHNGIIENYQKLRRKMEHKGFSFTSDTDTEVIAVMLDYYDTNDPVETIVKVMHRVEGSYALGIIFSEHPDVLYAARKDSPTAYANFFKSRFLDRVLFNLD